MKKKEIVFMKHLFTVCLFILFKLHIPSLSQDSTDISSKLKSLEQRIDHLEKRCKEYEKELALLRHSFQSNNLKSTTQNSYSLRYNQDKKKYSEKVLKRIERYYKVSVDKPNSFEARKKIHILLERYSDSNRAGCAILNLAHWESGSTKEHLLIHAFEKHNTCFYENGVQVGSYALFLLSNYYGKNGQKEKSFQLSEMLKTHFPRAVDHNGNLLIDQLGQEGLKKK